VLAQGKTRAVLLRKIGPVCRRAVPGRALYPEFLTNGGALNAGKRYIWGALYPEKTYIALMDFAQGTEGKERQSRESVISGERYNRVPLYMLQRFG